MHHLEDHHLLYDLQHGFRKARSCETQLLSLTHGLAQQWHKGIQTDLVIIDFTNAPFTPGGNYRLTGHDSANSHWLLVVAPSPRLVANVRRIVSKCHGNEKISFISATKWTVSRLSGIVETQLRHSHAGVAWLICKKTHYGSVAERCECTTTMSQLSPNSGVTNGDCKGEMASVRDNGQQIMMTLPQHLN